MNNLSCWSKTFENESTDWQSSKDFRSCISTWASDHKDEDIRKNAAALQNHGAEIHEAKYRRNKIRQALGQSMALRKDLTAVATEGEESENEVVLSIFV